MIQSLRPRDVKTVISGAEAHRGVRSGSGGPAFLLKHIDQDYVGASRMDQRDGEPLGSDLRFGVDHANALGLESLDRGLNVVDFKAEVMNALFSGFSSPGGLKSITYIDS